MIRYHVMPGALLSAVDGEFVEYAVAKRDIERLGNELFAARAALAANDVAHQGNLKRKDEEITQLRGAARKAAEILGYVDDEY